MRIIIYAIILVVSIFILFNVIDDKTAKIEVNNDYLVKNKPAKLVNFLPNKINKKMLLTYKIQDKNTSQRTIENIPSENEIFYIRVNNRKIKKIPIPIIDIINNELYIENNITTCEVSDYSANVFYYDALRTQISIFCKSKSQKNTIALILVENIGLTYLEVAKISSTHRKLYKIILSSIKEGNKEVSGNNLSTPLFVNFKKE